MSTLGRRGAQRIGYRHGQVLAARDLQEDAAYEARMRGLHVRTLHNTWGVALGFEVHLSEDRNAVLVGPGIAYDRAGREVISARTLVVETPAVPLGSKADAWWFDLVIRYNDLITLIAGRERDRGCWGPGMQPLEERPLWRWSFAGDATNPYAPPLTLAADVRVGEEIPLARFRMTAKRALSDPDFRVRRNTQGLVRPHIAADQIRQGSLPIQGSPWAWSVTVDTSAAGFSRTPFYLASLADHPLLNPQSGFAELLKKVSRDQLGRVLGPFVSIRSPHSRGFSLQVRQAMPNRREFTSMPLELMREARLTLPVAVSWTGIEPVAGCPPPLNLVSLRYLSGLVYQNTSIGFRNLLAILMEDSVIRG